MLSAATAVPNVKIKKTIETSELNNNFREKITEQIEDIPNNIKTDQISIFQKEKNILNPPSENICTIIAVLGLMFYVLEIDILYWFFSYLYGALGCDEYHPPNLLK